MPRTAVPALPKALARAIHTPHRFDTGSTSLTELLYYRFRFLTVTSVTLLFRSLFFRLSAIVMAAGMSARTATINNAFAF
jgi:hypothetical protein